MSELKNPSTSFSRYRIEKYFLILSTLFVFLLGAVLVLSMSMTLLKSDYWGHLWLNDVYKEYGEFLYPPLYYWTLDIINSILWYKYDYLLSSILILGSAIAIKYYLSYAYILRTPKPTINAFYLFPLGLMFFFPLYLFAYEGDYVYMGKFTSTIWHNCTSTFVWPFCILLSLNTFKWLDSNSDRYFWMICIFSLIIFLSKPNFLFAYLPALPLFLILVKPIKKMIIQGFGLSLALALMLFFAKHMIYDQNEMVSLIIPEPQNHYVKIDFFGVWFNYVQYPILDTMASFAFLGFALLFYWKELWNSKDFQFSFLLTAVGLVVFFVLVENGYRYGEANFYWQIPSTLFVLYMVILRILLPIFQDSYLVHGIQFKFALVILLFLAHVGSGIYYLFNYVSKGDFI